MFPYICIEKFSVCPFLKRPLKAVENFCRSKSKRISARQMNFSFIKAMLYTIFIIYVMDPWKFYKMEWLQPFQVMYLESCTTFLYYREQDREVDKHFKLIMSISSWLESKHQAFDVQNKQHKRDGQKKISCLYTWLNCIPYI